MMASGLFGEVFYQVAKGTLTLDELALKCALLDDSASFNASSTYMSSYTAREIFATNYNRGFSGSGRKDTSLAVAKVGATATISLPANLVWSALGGALNATVGAAVLYVPGSSDADSLLVAYFDIENAVTNGTDFTLVISSGGNVVLSNQ